MPRQTPEQLHAQAVDFWKAAADWVERSSALASPDTTAHQCGAIAVQVVHDEMRSTVLVGDALDHKLAALRFAFPIIGQAYDTTGAILDAYDR